MKKKKEVEKKNFNTYQLVRFYFYVILCTNQHWKLNQDFGGLFLFQRTLFYACKPIRYIVI